VANAPESLPYMNIICGVLNRQIGDVFHQMELTFVKSRVEAKKHIGIFAATASAADGTDHRRIFDVLR